LSLKSPFPWIWIAPVLIALRYGPWLSQASVGLLLAVYLFKGLAPIYTIDFQLFLLGGFLLTVLCAGFHSAWSKKIIDSNELSLYLQRRIQTISDAYKLTSLAYRGLEQHYIVKPITIRSSLQELRDMFAKSHQQKEVLNRFLNMLALHCSLEIAAIFPVKNKRLGSKPIVSIGKLKPVDQLDFLVKECMETSAITYIKASEMLKGHVSNILIVAPFINQEGNLYALLVVEAMPFLSLNDENIEIIRLLVQYFLEGNVVKNAELILKNYPDCPVTFANELQRLTHLQQRTRKDSAVVAFVLLPHPHQEEYLLRLKQEKRGIDTVWEMTDGNKKILIVAMPITYRIGVESFRMRVDDILGREFQTLLNEHKIKFKACQVSAFSNPSDLIKDLLH
jgi:hypothetical protein